MSHQRRTKIIATLGPSTDAPGVLDDLIAAGADCLRLNCSHAGADELRRRTAEVREAARKAGRPVAALFDLQGPKIRLSADVAERQLELGDEVIVTGPKGRAEDLRVELEDFPQLISERSEVIVGDGAPRMEVIECNERFSRMRVTHPGLIGPRKGVNVTYAELDRPALTVKDEEDLKVAAELDADFIALSFVRSAEDVQVLRDRLSQYDSRARVIAKIEKLEAYEDLDRIIEIADGIMIARGDFGVEAGLAAVPLMQKDAIERAARQGKLVITATQMLESMIHAPMPTRAEATDVANAIMDGTSATMLSAETAAGSWPVQAVEAMADLADAAETHDSIYCKYLDVDDLKEHPATAVMHAAVTLGRDIGAEALIVPTTSGGSVRAAAKYRPRRPIIAFAHDEYVANQLALEWGVHPCVTEYREELEEMITHVSSEAVARFPQLIPGRLAVISSGPISGTPGQTNLITIRPLPAAA